ncbi:4Fe-4S binding protein [Phocaeicola salanitronis]|uniref:4Fe-4S binding protein n=1 Tax=Phocaeicola salanitronis TaxID=376805 RepID=UPI0025A3F4C5|nr:4Fe-4S binding protein [Phocaeicola salanitronis]MDM8306617.1 4Fe-4S binding protein [Phocaeicola salanitronis]
MLQKIRQIIAFLFFCIITLLFLDFTGTLHAWFGWMAKIQFLPAVLTLNAGIILFLVVLTFVCGRIYCSVICPLGVFQDIAARIGRVKKKLPYSYSKAKNVLRYSVLVVFLALMFGGFASIAAFVAPYSAYGRIANNLFAPVYQWGNNLLAYFAERADSYAFYETEVWLKSLPTFLIAVLTFIIIGVLAWRNGRTYCNTICPVGTVLGFLSKFSLFRIEIDKEKCKKCNLCARNCKAACIDIPNTAVDHSRCVTCFDCLKHCKHDAIHYRFAYGKKEEAAPAHSDASQPKDKGRREVLAGSLLLLASAAKAQAVKKAEIIKLDGGLADIIDKQAPKRQTPITPPGSQSARRFFQHCTACQLCVSVCPNEVLRPSSSLDTFMQPVMSYERGYCRPECTKCAEVCPTDAIHLTDKAEKSATQIGHAVWVKDRCIPLTDGQACGNCARHCPTGAITMIPSDPSNPESLQIPAVDTEKCIGCGACENLCPARPLSAIYVEGHEVHRII